MFDRVKTNNTEVGMKWTTINLKSLILKEYRDFLDNDVIEVRKHTDSRDLQRAFK